MSEQPMHERAHTHVSVRIGSGFALVSAPTYALVDTTNADLAERLWLTIERGGGIDDLLELLSATGLRSLGDFALAQRESDAVRLVLRGAATAAVEGATGRREIGAGDVRTWVEEVVPACTGFVLALGPQPAGTMPFRAASAILPADALAWPVAAGGPSLPSADLGWVESYVAPELPVSVADPPAIADPPAHPASAEPEPAPEPEAEPGADPDPDPDPALAPQADPAREAPDPAPSVPAPMTLPADVDRGSLTLPASAMAAEANLTAEFSYDALYGHTVARSVSDAAVDTPQEDAVAPGMIQSVPTASAPAGAAPTSEQRPGDHDGMTISVAQLRAMRAPSGEAAPYTAPALGGPSVQALTCASGHVNPLTLTVCRVCSAPLNPTPVTVARPKLGQLVFSSGQVVPLDRPALIGRNPRVEGQMPNELPQIVKIDIGQALSRTHVAVRLEGWQVLVEDLGSANGTIVTLPGAPPRRLRAGEPVLLEHQAHIDLGGEVTATYDAWG